MSSSLEVRPKSTIARGKPLRSQAREIVFNVAQYFIANKKENEEKGDNRKYDVRQLISEVTAVSQRTISNILSDAKKSATEPGATPSFKTPTKKPKRKKTIQVDDFIDDAIRNKIQSFLLTLVGAYTPEKWKKVCGDAKKIEEEYRTRDHKYIVDYEIENISIDLGGVSNSDSDEYWSDSD